MSDELTTPQPAEPAGGTTDPSPASAPQAPAAPVSSEPGGTQSPPSVDPAQPASAPSEELEWNGNVDELPKQMQERGRSMLRHMHKVTQEAAEQSRSSQAALQESSYQDFLQKKNQPEPPPQEKATPFEVSQSEWEAAQTDPQAFTGLLNRAVESRLEQAEKRIMPVINDLRQKQASQEKERSLLKNERAIESFAQKNPEFWEINPMIMQAAFQKEVVEKKGTIEDAFKTAKGLKKQYLDEAQTTMQKKISEKKKAVSASPSKSEETTILYAETQAEADRLGFENARLGKTRDVRVRKKK